MEGDTISPFARQLYVMLKPAGPRCNLVCDYCYYLEKAQLYPNQAKAEMDYQMLEHFTREYIQAQTTREVLFVWHGGEPLLRPIAFYEQALKLQRKYAGGRHIDNAIQTNGTLLNDEWCRFFKTHNWLVDISIDGPQVWHDAYRRSRGGQPTWEKVMRGIELLEKHGVDWNAMAVVNRLNADHPEEFYRFFKEIGAHYIQFTPVVERKSNTHQLASPDEDGIVTDFSVKPEQWGHFLCRLFDEWIKEDVGQYFIQLFDATLANWCGVKPGVCSMSEDCGHAAVMEFNGDVYSCDHFVFPQYKLGNIRNASLVEMLYGPKQQAFSRIKRNSLPSDCLNCDYLFACHGECPKNRFIKTASGEKGLNYLCRGYKQFFDHVKPYMDFMRDEYFAGRPPANIMQVAASIKEQNEGLSNR